MAIACLSLQRASSPDGKGRQESKRSRTLLFMSLNLGRPWPSFRLQKAALSRAGNVPYMKAYDMATKNMAAQDRHRIQSEPFTHTHVYILQECCAWR